MGTPEPYKAALAACPHPLKDKQTALSAAEPGGHENTDNHRELRESLRIAVYSQGQMYPLLIILVKNSTLLCFFFSSRARLMSFQLLRAWLCLNF